MIQHSLRHSSYLEVAKAFYKIWEMPSVQEDQDGAAQNVSCPYGRLDESTYIRLRPSNTLFTILFWHLTTMSNQIWSTVCMWTLLWASHDERLTSKSYNLDAHKMFISSVTWWNGLWLRSWCDGPAYKNSLVQSLRVRMFSRDQRERSDSKISILEWQNMWVCPYFREYLLISLYRTFVLFPNTTLVSLCTNSPSFYS